MGFFRQWGSFMMLAARAHAKWELDVSRTILGDRKRLIILGILTLPALAGRNRLCRRDHPGPARCLGW